MSRNPHIRLATGPLALAFALIGLLPASPSVAQGVPCLQRATLLDRLASDQQTRRGMGQAGQAVMELFAAEDSHRWTLTVTLPDGRMCLLARGTGYLIPDGTFPTPGTPS
ncbi:MAG: hypothetical protein ACXIU7_11075 [Roseinatronobacter sp.]